MSADKEAHAKTSDLNPGVAATLSGVSEAVDRLAEETPDAATQARERDMEEGVTTEEAEKQLKAERREKRKGFRRERITTKPGLGGEYEVSLPLQQSLAQEFISIAERLKQLPKQGEGQRVFFEQIIHVSEQVQQRIKIGENPIQKDSELALILKSNEVFVGVVGLGLAFKVTNGGTTEGTIQLPATRELEDVSQGRGVGLINRHWFGLRDLIGVTVGCESDIRRFFWREPDRRSSINITCEPVDKAVVTEYFRVIGAEGWDQDDFLNYLQKLEDLNTQVRKAIGLEPLTNLTDRAFARLPNLSAGPESESGGYDFFENIRREKFEELIDQTSRDPSKSLVDKWNDLDPDQRLELWFRSYDLASEDMFEDIAAEIEKAKDERTQTRQQSRQGLLTAKGKELQEGKKIEVDKSEVDKARRLEADAKAKLDDLEVKGKRLRKIDRGEEGEQSELLQKEEAATRVRDAYDKALQRFQNSIDYCNKETGGLDKNIGDLESRIQGYNDELSKIQRRQSPHDKKNDRELEDVRRYYEGLRTQDTRSLEASRTERESLQQRLQTINDKLEALETAAVNAEAASKTLQKEQTELINSFSGETDPTKQAEIIQNAREAYLAKEQEADRLETALTKGFSEPTPEDKKEGKEIERIGQIVGAKSEIKGMVNEDWLKELTEVVQQQDWDRAQQMILELVFESTGEAKDKLVLSKKAQEQILSKSKITLVAMRELLIGRPAVLEAADISAIDANTGKVADYQLQIEDLQTRPEMFTVRQTDIINLLTGYGSGVIVEMQAASSAEEAIKILQEETVALRKQDLIRLGKAFSEVAPYLTRNQVQTQRVIGTLVDELFYSANNLDLRGIPTELQPAPIEKPPASHEEKTVRHIEIEVGEASCKGPDKKDWGGAIAESSLPESGGITTRVEAEIRGLKKAVELGVEIKADSVLYNELSKYTSGQEALNAHWPTAVINHFFGGTGVGNILQPRETVVDNSFIVVREERKGNFDEVIVDLEAYGTRHTGANEYKMPELSTFYPAAVAKMIYTEIDPAKKKRYERMFRGFETVVLSDFTLDVDYEVVFKKGQLLVTARDANRKAVMENMPIQKAIANYKRLYMEKNTITDEANLNPAHIKEIREGAIKLLAVVGKEALRALYQG